MGMHNLDVNVNMTLQVSDAEWENAQTEAQEESTTPAMLIAQLHLDGEELVCCSEGRAWVCSVDSASYIEKVTKA